MPLPGRRPAPVDWLIVGLGNPGAEYVGTRHNIGFEVAERLRTRWDLGRPKSKYRGLISDGRTGPGGPRVAILLPQTYMNDVGRSVGPARGELRVEPDRIVVIHDEIDLPFGEIRPRLGGGLAGHNGLRSVRAALGTPDFHRVRIGVGRPPTTDPDRVAAYVLGKFREPKADVEALIDAAADAAERLIEDVRADNRRQPSRLDRCHLMLSSLLHHADDDPQTQILAQDGGRAFVSMSLRPFLVAALTTETRRPPRSSSPATTAPRGTWRRACGSGSLRARSATTRAAASPTSRTWRRRRT